MKAITFVAFCIRVLHLQLTNAQRVLAMVAIDGVQPSALDDADREIARALFGDVDTIPDHVRRVLVWSLGRGSGKTTIAAALMIYAAVTGDISRVGPGMVAASIALAPRASTVKILIGVARELVRGAPDLECLVADDDDTKEGFALMRGDRRVRTAGFAASRGGVNVRGFDLLLLVLDEAELFRSESDAAVTDRDSYNGAAPRLLHGHTHHALFIGTPWPVPTMMGELFTKNFGAPQSALAAVGTSLTMRDNDPVLAEEIAGERLLNPENTARERDCDRSANGVGMFFDDSMITTAAAHALALPLPPYPGSVGIGGDLGFVHDSSTQAIAQRHPTGRIAIVALEELRPKPGAPLVPSKVAAHFATVSTPWRNLPGGRSICLDNYYIEAAREYFADESIQVIALPSGNEGKFAQYQRFREMLHHGSVMLPANPRLLSQLRSITSHPLPGGGVRIDSPRRVGMAHGDLVSAVVGAAWALGDADALRDKIAALNESFDLLGWSGAEGRARAAHSVIDERRDRQLRDFKKLTDAFEARQREAVERELALREQEKKEREGKS